MKKYLVALCCFIAFTASSQIRKIPAEVTSAFEAKYPKAEKVEWKDNLTNFEASFTYNDAETSAKFNSKGEWLVTEKKIEFDALPADVKDGFKKSKYEDWELRGVKIIEEKDKAISYRILVKKNDVQKKYLFYDAKGKLLRDPIAI